LNINGWLMSSFFEATGLIDIWLNQATTHVALWVYEQRNTKCIFVVIFNIYTFHPMYISTLCHSKRKVIYIVSCV